MGGGRSPASGPHPDLSRPAAPYGRGPGGQPGPGAGGPPPGDRISPGPDLRAPSRHAPGHPRGPRPHTPVRPGDGAPVPLGSGLLSVSPGGGVEFPHPRGGADRQPAPGTLGLPDRTTGSRARASASGPQIPSTPHAPEGSRPHPGERSSAPLPRLPRQPAAPGRPGLDRARRPHPSPDPRG